MRLLLLFFLIPVAFAAVAVEEPERVLFTEMDGEDQLTIFPDFQCTLTDEAVITVFALSNLGDMIYYSRDPLHFVTNVFNDEGNIRFDGGELAVRVRSMKSDIAIYNPTFNQVLNHRDYPLIRVRLKRLRRFEDDELIPGAAAGMRSSLLALEAEMEMAGNLRPITFMVQTWKEGQGYRMKGVAHTLLSYFDLDAPDLLFGTFMVRDAFRIEFDFGFRDAAKEVVVSKKIVRK